MIITRYLIKEILQTTLAVLLVLLAVGLSNEFVVQLSKAAAGELPATLVFKVVETAIPGLIATLLPLGFFLGVVLAYGRLFADAEMTVLLACGFSWSRLTVIVALPAVLLTLVSLYLQVSLAPHSLARQEKLLDNAQSDLLSYAMTAGKFEKSLDGRTIFFAQSVSADKKQAQHIFIAELPEESEKKSAPWRVTAGQHAYRWQSDEWGADYIVVDDGHRYQGNPGEKNFTVTQFGQYGIQLIKKKPTTRFSLQATPSSELRISQDISARVEWLCRISFPFTLLVVILLAVPLSVVKPRQGKYANLLPAMIVIIVYINTLMMTASWIREGIVPEWLGFWLVHFIAASIGVYLLKRRASCQGNM